MIHFILGYVRSQLNPYRIDRYKSILEQIRSDPKALLGLGILVALLLTAIFESVLMPYDPLNTNPINAREAPSMTHLFGTDEFGRDVLSRVIAGTRISLYVGLSTILIATIVGVPLGMVGGYFKGYVDEVLMRLMDAMMAFPAILLALVLLTVLGQSLNNVVIALGFVYTPHFARVARSSVLTVSERDYVASARVRGESNRYILFREILPNIGGPVIVQASITFAYAILAEAGLSFLGMGTQPPNPSWGLMISESRGVFQQSPWLMLFPGIAISITVIGLNMFGDALRDIIDPEIETETKGGT